MWAYWRTPSYNFVRLMMTICTALLYGAIYYEAGKAVNTGTVSVFVCTRGGGGAMYYDAGNAVNTGTVCVCVCVCECTCGVVWRHQL